MHELTKIILNDMKPALGVTEPGAIAFACARAHALIPGDILNITVRLNSGMYKNAFTCGIPGTGNTGILFAAALGALCGDYRKGLEVLQDVTPEAEIAAGQMVARKRVKAEMTAVTSRIFVEAEMETDRGRARVRIRDTHTNITQEEVNGEMILDLEASGGGAGGNAGETARETPPQSGTGQNSSANDAPKAEPGVDTAADTAPHLIHQYSVQDFLKLADQESSENLAPIREAFTMNLALFRQGLNSPRTTFSKYLLQENGGKVISEDPLRTAQLLSAGAIEARVLGLSLPAMSITGSGSHGIIATLPLYAYAKIRKVPEDDLLRAALLSFLICTYIKEYSGRLSAFCGCGIAAGTGMACGLARLRGGSSEDMDRTIRNMAAGITGMICDGGNQGCVMKNIAAVDAAFRASDLALAGVAVDPVHGILGNTPEETMRNMGRIASPGMTGTEKTITDIMGEK
ncbi:L-cysteine desulfidase [Eubacterium pyruvativorans]|uniref:UPF0597 protein SAMN05216508_10420 n=1 Tax=Eubacterium pyruvativorans TaxID=155865 RepID=A0A1I7FYH0_9FIRM|nr:L-serine ammonia-lyase, iron-sulfur-dependent, subunit alpha [Eubacterium pyruvativorans]SFO01210.1 L-cysteine desulfidase [Eubacterium pyruvativorans]SFU41207.1 L-cysteine desulfidase [Eubacterium pyruvativorans]